MYLMLDVVTNHFAYDGAGNDVDYSIFAPFNSESYFHPFCLIDYDNITSIQQCWEGDNIVSLPDLRTEDEDVYSVWESWIENIVSTYGVDGIRLDRYVCGVEPPFSFSHCTALSFHPVCPSASLKDGRTELQHHGSRRSLQPCAILIYNLCISVKDWSSPNRPG